MGSVSAFLIVSILSLSLVRDAVAAPVVVAPAGESYAYVIGGIAEGTNVDLGNFTPNTQPFYSHYIIPQGYLTLWNAGVVTNNDRNGFFQHVRPSGVGRDDNYLAVYGRGFMGFAGAAVFSLTTPANSFAFTWGSIDSYNWLEVTNGNNESYIITGDDIMASAVGIREGKTSKHFSLTDISGIVRVVLRSCSDAFEVANIRISNVPLPPALPVFVAAVIGLAVVRRQQKKTSTIS